MTDPWIDYKWNKKNLGKWIEALRSGKYPQGKNGLCRNSAEGQAKGQIKPDGYCCLGVVSKISRLGKFTIPGAFMDTLLFKDNTIKDDIVAEHDSRSYLTKNVQKWLGVTSSDPWISLGEGWERQESSSEFNEFKPVRTGAMTTCSLLNDDWGLTLPQIADMLEYFVYNNLPDENTNGANSSSSRQE